MLSSDSVSDLLNHYGGAKDLGLDVAALKSGYIDFLLQEAVHSYTEKVDVFETLAHRHSSYAFGMAPPTFAYTAAMRNDYQNDWSESAYKLYWYLLRAHSIAELKTPVILSYDGMSVKGSMVSFQERLSARDESFTVVNFQILVTEVFAQPPVKSNWDDYYEGALETPVSMDVRSAPTVTRTTPTYTKLRLATPKEGVPEASDVTATSENFASLDPSVTDSKTTEGPDGGISLNPDESTYVDSDGQVRTSNGATQSK